MGERKTNTGVPGDSAVLEREPQVMKPRKWCVLFHNDDYTTMDFVVEVLRVIFHMNFEQAEELMMRVHTDGKGVAGVYTRDVAETKAEQVMDIASKVGMPLLVTVEPE